MLCTASARLIRMLFGIGLILTMLSGATGVISSVSAEPLMVRTTPLDGEILQRTPTAVGVGFDEALNRDESRFRLLYPDGSEVEGISLAWDSRDTSVTLNLPRDFSDGVYTITWSAVSANDGSVSNGWSSFSVGNPEDAGIITIPTSGTGHQGPPTWLQAGARFIALFGIAVSLSTWPIWRGIIRPSLGKARNTAVPTTMAIQKWAWIALAIAIAGSLAELVIQSQALSDASMIDAVMQTLGHDEWGFWWMLRMGILVMLGIVMAISPWWYPRWAKLNDAMLWCFSLMLPFSLILGGHAVTDEVGRITTVTTNYLWLLSIGLLVGGTIWFGISLRKMHARAHEDAINQLRTRFTWLIITAGLTAIVAGIYLGTLFAGNSDALTQTPFGMMLMVQVALVAIAIVIAGLLLTRQIVNTSALALTSTLAAVFTLILLTTSTTDVLTPARTELVERSVQTREDLSFGGRQGIFLIAPGEVGVNHWRLETPGTYLQTETEVFVELSSPSFPEIGTKTVQMYRVQGNAFEHHGTEFSLMGDWEITLRIEEPGFDPGIATYTQTIGEENTTVNLPDAPWKFGNLAGLAALILVLTGVVGVATAATAGKGPLRKEAGGLAGVAIALAVVVILQGRIDPLLVVESGEGAINPNDMVMVTRGEQAYKTYCASCHGDGLRGDGPLADALNPPPVDFSQPHTKVHSDEDLIYWIQYGIQGTAMPGFRSQMTDQDIRDVISFIYWWQQDDGASYTSESGATPEPALGVCEVAPLQYSELQALFQHGLHPETRRGTPLVRAGDSSVSAEQSNEVMWTIEQLVNCANQDQFLSQVRLFTKPMVQDIFPLGASYEVTSRATSPSTPVDPADAIVIQDVQSVSLLADGRIAVTVIFHDPTGIGVVPGADPLYQVTLVLTLEDGVWLIDEVR